MYLQVANSGHNMAPLSFQNKGCFLRKWAENNGRLLAQLHGNLTPAWFSRGPARCLRRFKRSDYDGKGVSLSCLRVVARRLPHLLYGPVKSLRLSRWGKASWRTCRPARRRQNVSVCPMTRRHCPAGVFVKEQRGRRENRKAGKGKAACLWPGP